MVSKKIKNLIRDFISLSYIMNFFLLFRNTDYGSWTRKHGRLYRTNMEQTVCRYSKPGIFALGAAVPVSCKKIST